MIVKDLPEEKLGEIFSNLDEYIEKKYGKKWVKYVNLGTHVLRIVSYCDEYKPLIEKQLMYVSDFAQNYDATLVIWKEDDIENLHKNLHYDFNSKLNLKLRVEMIALKRKLRFFKVFDKKYSKTNPLIESNFAKKTFSAFNEASNTHYYAVENLEPEEFIKEGHIFIQAINKVVKGTKTNVVHGAVVGMNNNGVLFCARGQRGKSTLTVLSMLTGFEYVSHDYLVFEKDGENLYSYPIYSIITLSPKMYNELYDELKDCRFVSNNARKDKYVFNISNLENQFRTKYPIKVCMFPEIVKDKEPSIKLCEKEEKERAIVQLIQSTVAQMRDICNQDVIKKILNMIKDFEFYKINLCSDIYKNTEFLREFLKNYKEQSIKTKFEDGVFVDITFDIANILDSKTGTIYQMNKFATNVFENLLSGANKNEILEKIKNIKGVDENISLLFNIFVKEIDNLSLLKNSVGKYSEVFLKQDLIAESGFELSFKKFGDEGTKELLKIGE